MATSEDIVTQVMRTNAEERLREWGPLGTVKCTIGPQMPEPSRLNASGRALVTRLARHHGVAGQRCSGWDSESLLTGNQLYS
jgi:hypothetical protein